MFILKPPSATEIPIQVLGKETAPPAIKIIPSIKTELMTF